MKKRTLSLMLAAAMVLGSLTGCSTGQKEESKETAAVTEAAKAGEDAAATAAQEAGTQPEDGEKKVYAFVSKTAADPIFLLMFDGYKAACDKLGVEAVYRGADQPTAEKEIEIITQLIAQNVDAITVIGADFNALQPILQQAMSQGIAVNSVDTAVNPDSRQVHVEQCSIDEVGRAQMQSALAICGGPGSSGKIGILSANPESQLHADWCKAMLLEVEEHPEDYKNIEVLDIAYGDDLPDKSTSEAQAMLQNNPDLKAIISPTTVGILAAAKVIQDQGSDCKVTGVGLPSEMAPYIENGICYDAYLWNPLDQGALGAYSAHALVTGAATGKVGDIVDAGDLGQGNRVGYAKPAVRVHHDQIPACRVPGLGSPEQAESVLLPELFSDIIISRHENQPDRLTTVPLPELLCSFQRMPVHGSAVNYMQQLIAAEAAGISGCQQYHMYHRSFPSPLITFSGVTGSSRNQRPVA